MALKVLDGENSHQTDDEGRISGASRLLGFRAQRVWRIFQCPVKVSAKTTLRDEVAVFAVAGPKSLNMN